MLCPTPNGARAVAEAVRAGVDSIEHGNYVDEEALQLMAESDVVWVPTITVVKNLISSADFRIKSLSISGLWEAKISAEALNLGYIWLLEAMPELIGCITVRDFWTNGGSFPGNSGRYRRGKTTSFRWRSQNTPKISEALTLQPLDTGKYGVFYFSHTKGELFPGSPLIATQKTNSFQSAYGIAPASN